LQKYEPIIPEKENAREKVTRHCCFQQGVPTVVVSDREASAPAKIEAAKKNRSSFTFERGTKPPG
jgi:hypothetical protein